MCTGAYTQFMLLRKYVHCWHSIPHIYRIPFRTIPFIEFGLHWVLTASSSNTTSVTNSSAKTNVLVVRTKLDQVTQFCVDAHIQFSGLVHPHPQDGSLHHTHGRPLTQTASHCSRSHWQHHWVWQWRSQCPGLVDIEGSCYLEVVLPSVVHARDSLWGGKKGPII